MGPCKAESHPASHSSALCLPSSLPHRILGGGSRPNGAADTKKTDGRERGGLGPWKNKVDNERGDDGTYKEKDGERGKWAERRGITGEEARKGE